MGNLGIKKDSLTASACLLSGVPLCSGAFQLVGSTRDIGDSNTERRKIFESAVIKGNHD